jgi:hypothetical protein
VILCAAVGAVVGVFAEQPWYRATTLVPTGYPLSMTELSVRSPISGPGSIPGAEERGLREWEWLAHSPELAFRVQGMHHGIGALKLRSGFSVSQHELPKLIDATDVTSGKRIHDLAAGGVGLALSQVAPSRRNAIDLANLYARALTELRAKYASAELEARYRPLLDRPWVRKDLARTEADLRRPHLGVQAASSAEPVRRHSRPNGILGGSLGLVAGFVVVGMLSYRRKPIRPHVPR